MTDYWWWWWYGCLLSQASSSWYFSWTSGDPHRSGFKLHTAVLSVLWVTIQVIIIIIIIIIVIIIIIMSLVTSLFFLVLLLNQRWSPPLRLQVWHCSTFRIMSDDPSCCCCCYYYYYYYYYYVSCHKPLLPGTSLEPAVIPTAKTSSFTLQYFPYYVWCPKVLLLLSL